MNKKTGIIATITIAGLIFTTGCTSNRMLLKNQHLNQETAIATQEKQEDYRQISLELLTTIRKELEVAKRDAEAARRHWELLNAITR